MPFPSLVLLKTRASAVLGRYPLTLLAGTLAASAAIAATTDSLRDVQPEWWWVRLAGVALLGLPVTIALAITGAVQQWTPSRRWAMQGIGMIVLLIFGMVWRGVRQEHDAWIYLQVSAVAHLTVAFLPFLGRAESSGFWQYNRHLFLGFLKAGVFSCVLFVGTAVALAALKNLFNVDIPDEAFARTWFVYAFIVHPWIFLAAIPADLDALSEDRGYPRALQVFAQYILTPLVFTYLVLLLAYLLKIIAGGEWPRGWIGWLVASVSVTGLLGFLLVHPLRQDPREGWIRGYSRWLFVGLIPAALMLLVAFWKRIEPYGLTEPRAAGVVLGVWLLCIAVFYTVRQGAGIRVIPVSLATLLLMTAFGPLGLTRLSVASQGRRLTTTLARSDSARVRAREVSAAIRFLVERRAVGELAARLDRDVPSTDWNRLASSQNARDSLAQRLVEMIGVQYVGRYETSDTHFSVTADTESPVPLGDRAWAVPVTNHAKEVRVIEGDTVRFVSDTRSLLIRLVHGTSDTLSFDLRTLLSRADSASATELAASQMQVDEQIDARRASLWVTHLIGERTDDSVTVTSWSGWLLLPPRAANAVQPRGADTADRRP